MKGGNKRKANQKNWFKRKGERFVGSQQQENEWRLQNCLWIYFEVETILVDVVFNRNFSECSFLVNSEYSSGAILAQIFLRIFSEFSRNFLGTFVEFH